MKSILERWQLTGTSAEVSSNSRGAFQAQAGAELQLGSAESELEAIRRQLGTMNRPARPIEGAKRR